MTCKAPYHCACMPLRRLDDALQAAHSAAHINLARDIHFDCRYGEAVMRPHMEGNIDRIAAAQAFADVSHIASARKETKALVEAALHHMHRLQQAHCNMATRAHQPCVSWHKLRLRRDNAH
jgi:hypothetical protein